MGPGKGLGGNTGIPAPNAPGSPRQAMEWAGQAAEVRRERRDALVVATTQEFADHLRDAAANAKPYIREYAKYLTDPKTRNPPLARGMHPLLGELIRELMRDAEVSRRRAS